MQLNNAAFLFCALSVGLSAQTLTSLSYHGSGSDSANGITTDAAGNIYIVGTTNSTDLPLLNPSQPVNAGSQLIFSPDAGLTWKPLGNLPGAAVTSVASQFLPVAIDPKNAAVFYVGFSGAIFKSTDSGAHFSSGVPITTQGFEVVSIKIDPSDSSIVYAATGGGLFKSSDGGVTWTNHSSTFPVDLDGTINLDSVVIDPFHPKSLWAVVNGLAFLSTDGAETWSQPVLPSVAAGNNSVVAIAFDAATPDVLNVYGGLNGTYYLLKSTDGGKTWSQRSTPFAGGVFVADPVRAGYLYGLVNIGPFPASFYRSSDGGATWQSFPFPAPFASCVAIDPANPNIVIAGSYRSTDNGATWSPTAVSRDIQAAFAPTGKGALFASGPITSDIFIAKFAPDGKTLEFATYYGGMGNETASGIQVDKSGNIWVTGSTTSFDLPVTKNAFQQQLKGNTNAFVAEFSPKGRLHAATYLGGSKMDTPTAIKLNSAGEPWIYGQTNSPDFPLLEGGPPVLQPGANYVFLASVSPSASKLLYSASIDGANTPGRMSIDAEDNILLAGTTFSSNFSATPGVVHGVAPPGQVSQDAYLIKLDSSGNVVFSTYFGGSKGGPGGTTMGGLLPGSAEAENLGFAATSDATGIYVTGSTSMIDFPTTPGAYQTQLRDGCPYASLEVNTGLIGVLSFYIIDDVFVMKLSPDGKKLLYSTLLGGSCWDRPTDIAVTPSGAIFVTGETNSVDFPVVYPLIPAPAIRNYESFVSMLDAKGAMLLYSTYLLAGSGPSLALSPGGKLEIAGSTGFGAQTITFSGFPFGPIIPMTQAYLAELDLSGSRPKLDLTDVRNAFSLRPGPIAPGEIIQLTVGDFQPAQALNVGLGGALQLGTSLGGVEVLFDGRPVPVMTISRGKIVCIAPPDLAPNGTATVQVNFNGTPSNPLTVSLAPLALGLLSADGSGTGLANARNNDGKLNSPTHPAKRGTTVTVYFTGAGVPPASIYIQLPNGVGGPVMTAPLRGFVPGIYAAYFQAPTDPTIPSPMLVNLLSGAASSQSLLVYIE